MAAEGGAHQGGTSPLHKAPRARRPKADPFFALSDDAVNLPDQPSPSDRGGSRADDVHSGSLFADCILTPISMLALLLSLLWVDEAQRRWRLLQHGSSRSEPPWSMLSTPKSPYSQRHQHKPQARASAASRSDESESSRWYYRKKHRAIAKLELTDALEMRGRVVAALVFWSLAMLCAFAYSLRQLYFWWSM